MDAIGDYGSSSDEEEEKEEEEKAKKQPATTTGTSSGPKSILKTKLPSPSSMKSTTVAAPEKKGKKILSLHAVLPPHILAQLTQSQVQGADGEEDDDDDDDDDDNWQQKKAPTSAAAGSRAGITSFLTELNKSTPKTAAAATQSKASSSSSSKLGAAFLSTTTVVTTETKGSHAVRDIHGESSSYSADTVETKAMEERKPAATLKAVPAPSTSKGVVPSAPSISVAEKQDMLPPPPPPAAAAVSMAPQSTATTTVISSKRQRQQRERLLRQGQFDAALSDQAHVSRMEQPASQNPTDGASQHVDTTGLIRNAATALYQPAVGQAVVGASGTGAGRGKNQINHLLASAASLDLARARGLVGSNAGKTARNTGKRKYGW